MLATNAVDLVLDQATGDLTAILLASGDNCTVASAFVSADGVWYHLRLAITPAWLNLTVAPDSGSAPLGCQAPVSSPGPSARCRLYPPPAFSPVSPVWYPACFMVTHTSPPQPLRRTT